MSILSKPDIHDAHVYEYYYQFLTIHNGHVIAYYYGSDDYPLEDWQHRLFRGAEEVHLLFGVYLRERPDILSILESPRFHRVFTSDEKKPPEYIRPDVPDMSLFLPPTTGEPVTESTFHAIWRETLLDVGRVYPQLSESEREVCRLAAGDRQLDILTFIHEFEPLALCITSSVRYTCVNGRYWKDVPQ